MMGAACARASMHVSACNHCQRKMSAAQAASASHSGVSRLQLHLEQIAANMHFISNAIWHEHLLLTALSMSASPV
jgi:hypothetical protein